MADRYHVFQLTSPIKTHDGEKHELKMKYPKARTFIRHGVPFTNIVERTDDGATRTSLNFDTKKMFAFIADMSGIDDLVLETIEGEDVMPLFYSVTAMLSGGGDKLGESAGSST